MLSGTPGLTVSCRPVLAEGAKVLASPVSGDEPLTVRVRPSSVTGTAGQRAQVKVPGERTREVTLDPGASLRTLRSESKGQAGACPNRTRAIPCTVRAVTGSSMIPEYTRNDPGRPRDEHRVQAGRSHNSLDRRGGLRSREHARSSGKRHVLKVTHRLPASPLTWVSAVGRRGSRSLLSWSCGFGSCRPLPLTVPHLPTWPRRKRAAGSLRQWCC
jgi:hypothetical protein